MAFDGQARPAPSPDEHTISLRTRDLMAAVFFLGVSIGLVLAIAVIAWGP